MGILSVLAIGQNIGVLRYDGKRRFKIRNSGGLAVSVVHRSTIHSRSDARRAQQTLPVMHRAIDSCVEQNRGVRSTFDAEVGQ